MGLFSCFPCIRPSKKRTNTEKRRAKLYLNVYDVTPANNYLYWFGLGIHHSGIEAHGIEYAFGIGEQTSSGVFEVEPRRCAGFIFRRSILLGRIDMSPSEFSSFMEHISALYHPDAYDLFSKNCNHFTDEVCRRLTGKHIPGWVNRLARVGCFVESLLPESDKAKSVKHLPEKEYSGDLQGEGDDSETESEEGDHLLRA